MARAEVRERLDPTDAYELDPDSIPAGMHWRWVHPRNHARRISQGYEIALRGKHGVRFLIEDGRLVEEGGDRLWRGESYLMLCKKEVYNARRRRHVQYTEDLKQQEQAFAEKAKRKGVRPLIGEEGEEHE